MENMIITLKSLKNECINEECHFKKDINGLGNMKTILNIWKRNANILKYI